jgi:tetratricopeptide (TPR) repeat protein
MSVESIRTALAALISDPQNSSAWAELQDATAGDGAEQLSREIERARLEHEKQHSWQAAARLLDIELRVTQGASAIASKHLLRARIFHEELYRDDDALEAFRGALSARPDDAKAKAAIADILAQREKWEATVSQLLVDAGEAGDGTRKARFLVAAADTTLRHAERSAASLARVAGHLDAALSADPENRRALTLAAVVYEELQRWDDAARVIARLTRVLPAKGDKIATAARAARLHRTRLDDQSASTVAHEALLELDPGNPVAVGYLRELYAKTEAWPALVALFERMLGAGTVKQAEEFAIWLQVANLNWEALANPEAAEPYFEKIRKADPLHPTMLRFFRERCRTKEDAPRLMAILTDAQRATSEDETKRKLAEEIAELAESQENAKHAIEQYKTILRSDPNDSDAREKLKKLYLQTESFNALVELYRQDLQRLSKDDAPARIAILRQMAEIYRDRMKSDTALLTVLTQILQLDERDIDAVRGLISVYEALSRWRDLLSTQQKLADITDDAAERVELLRAVARRWLEQFSNVQNAIGAYESLLEATGDDAEARDQLIELYQKRRTWPKLYELYEKQLEQAEGEGRIKLLGEMAKLAAERLDKGDEAIRLWRQVYSEAPETEGVLDALEKQSERQKDFHTAAFVLEARVEQGDLEKKIALLQKLGALQAEKLADTKAANRSWRRVLELSPGHTRALRVLRQSFVEARDWDGLEELYASQNDWEGLADFLSTTADRTDPELEKVGLSFRAARIYEEKLGAPERAARSYERVLSAEPKNLQAASALLPLYEQEGKWSRLPGLHGVLLAATDDVGEKVAILLKMASITGVQLANKAAALQYSRQAYDLRPDDEGLGRLREWSQLASDWSPFMEVLRARLVEAAIDPKRARELESTLADVYAQHLGKLDEAVAIFRRLVEADPHDESTVGTFDHLLRANGRKDDIRWLFELKANRFTGLGRVAALEEWAQVEQDVFGEPERSISLLERVFAEDATRTGSLAELTRLLVASDRYDRASEVMLAHRDAETGSVRVRLETELATMYLERLAAPESAFEACVRALEFDPENERAIAILERLTSPLPEGAKAEPGSVRARAAKVLEEHYHRAGKATERVRALRAMLEHEEKLAQRLELRRNLADALERDLSDVQGAFEVTLQALAEASDELELWDRVERLAAAAARPKDLAAAYHRHVGDDAEASNYSKELRIDLCERAAALHEEKLDDSEGAIPYLQQVLALDKNHERAFARLKAILTGASRWQDLETLYGRAIDSAEDDATRIEHLLQSALLAEELLQDDAKAVGHYERVVALDATHADADAALERLYARTSRFDALARLLEARLERLDDDANVAIRLRLVDLYLHKVKVHTRVLSHLTSVLEGDPGEAQARALTEECLSIDALRQPAASLLDGVYERRDEIRDLTRIIAVRLEGADSDDQRRELLRRLATLRDERLKDDAAAFEALAELVPLEPEDAVLRDRFIQIGQRTAAHEKVAAALTRAASNCQAQQARGELLMAAAGVAGGELGDDVRAEKLLRETLSLDPDDALLAIPAARALSEIYEKRSDHASLAATLETEVKLVADGEERARLFERIAGLYETKLTQRDAAIGAWNQRLADEPTDITALSALERLYGDTSRWRELLDILRRIEQSSAEATERKRCMTKVARVLGDELEAVTEAIDAWRAVQDDFGPEPAALQPLAALYEKGERYQDLADTLDTWLSIAADAAKVDLYVRLGDVRRSHLAAPSDAMACYRAVLERDRGHGPARAGLEALLGHETSDVRREAAEILGPIYRADNDAQKLLKVLEIEAEATTDIGARLEILDRALGTAEDVLDNPNQAFEYAARGVREATGEPTIATWIATAERLARLTERFGDLLDLVDGVIEQILDAEVQHETRLRSGELARTKLGDDARAIRHYRAALDARGDDPAALRALEELYTAVKDDAHLFEILVLRAENAPEGERIGFLLRAGKLQAESLGDRSAAIRKYEEVLEITLHSEAVEAVDALYRSEAQFDRLVALLERQVDVASGKLVGDLRVKLATVLIEHLADIGRALEELDCALDVDSMHKGAIATLEGLLDKVTDPEHKAHVAKALEPVYRSTADWQKLKNALEARVDAAGDPSERGALLDKLAQHYEEQLEDYSMALETVARRLREDTSNERIWDKIESLGGLIGTGAEARVAEIFASALTGVDSDDPKTAQLSERTGELFAMAERHEDALRWYRRSYDFSPDSETLFHAIDGLLVTLDRKEDRVEHYKQGVEAAVDADKRVVYFHVIAKLQRQLGRDGDAIQTYRDLVDLATDDEVALDGLTELYRAAERRDDLAELYERRADLAPEPEQAAAYRLELARLLATNESDRDRALEQLEQIAEAVPSHEEATSELEKLLEDDARKERVIEILARLYERNDDWRKLVGLSEHRLALQTEPLDRAAILLDSALVWEERGRDLIRAFEIARQAFELAPESEDVRAQLERLAESTSSWALLAEAYEAAARTVSDRQSKLTFYAAIAEVCEHHLNDPTRSLAALVALAPLDPSDETILARIDELCVQLGQWDTLAKAIEERVEDVDDADQKARLLERLGEIRQDMLDDEDGAVAVLEQAILLDSQSIAALDRLIWLHEARDPRRLVALLEQRIDATQDDDERRHEFCVRAAEVFEKELERPTEAIRMLEQARDIVADDLAVLASLERLYGADERWSDLLDNLKTQAELAQDVEKRATLRNRMGDLCLSELRRQTDALEFYRMVLEESPEDAHAAATVHRLAREDEDLRLEITALLEPIYAHAGRFEELVDVMDLRVSAQSDALDRAETLLGMARVLEEQLDALERARDTAIRALLEVYSEGTPTDSAMHDDIERLCELTEDYANYADALEKLAPEVYDGATQADLYERVGVIAETQLGDPPRAIEAYRKAADQSDAPAALLAALDRLYVQSGDNDRLAGVLERRLESEPEDEARAALHYRLALLCEAHLHDAVGAVDQLERCVELAPDHEPARKKLEELTEDRELFDRVADILDELYRLSGDGEARVRLRNKRIDFTESTAERLRLRVELSQVLEEENDNPMAAQRAVELALADGPVDEDVLERLERLAGINGAGDDGARAWIRAGNAVTKALGSAIAKAAAQPAEHDGVRPDLARDVYLRVATWYEENVEDVDLSEYALNAALEQDPECADALVRLEDLQRAQSRDRELVGTLRRLADLIESGGGVADREASEVRREAKELAEQSLHDVELAEVVLREMLAAYDGDVWALAELSSLCELKGAHEERFELLKRRIELTSETEELRQLRHDAALVAESKLENGKAAIDLFEQAFDDDASDVVAATALRRLYPTVRRNEDLVRLLDRLIDREDDASARAELRLEGARVSLAELGATTDAIEQLKAVLDELPGHLGAVDLLTEVLEKDGRDDELVELVERQVEHAREQGNRESELTLRLRYAELQETRRNDVDRAIDGYLAVLDADGAHRPALEALARLYEGQGRAADAAEICEKLLEGATTDEAVRLALKARDLFGDDDEGATRVLEIALMTDGLVGPSVRTLREALEDLYRKLEMWQELATSITQRADESDDDAERVMLYRRAADVHVEQRQDQQAAAELLEKAFDLQPDNRELMLALADAFSAAGQGDDALGMLQKIVEASQGKRSKELADIHLRIAAVQLARGEDLAALEELEAARKLDPANLKVAGDLGRLSLELYDGATDQDAKGEHLKRAEAVYKSLLLQKIEEGAAIAKAEVFVGMAKVLLRMDDPKKAIHNLERAIAADAHYEPAHALLDELNA